MKVWVLNLKHRKDRYNRITKALDKEGSRLFQDGDKASLRREVEANILQEIQLAMLESGSDKEVDEAKADMKIVKEEIFGPVVAVFPFSDHQDLF